jgi:hypothetical protein
MTDENPMTSYLQNQMPFAKACGIRVSAATPAEVHGEMDWDPGLCTVAGVMHGGALMTFADTIGATCAAMNLPADKTTTTVESNQLLPRSARRLCSRHRHPTARRPHAHRRADRRSRRRGETGGARHPDAGRARKAMRARPTRRKRRPPPHAVITTEADSAHTRAREARREANVTGAPLESKSCPRRSPWRGPGPPGKCGIRPPPTMCRP